METSTPVEKTNYCEFCDRSFKNKYVYTKHINSKLHAQNVNQNLEELYDKETLDEANALLEFNKMKIDESICDFPIPVPEIFKGGRTQELPTVYVLQMMFIINALKNTVETYETKIEELVEAVQYLKAARNPYIDSEEIANMID